VDLAEVVKSAVETARPLLDRMGHRLTVALPEPPVALDGDPTRLTQVFANLLNNAAKYTDPGGHVRPTAGREGGEAVVRVADDGIGIPADRLAGVFEMFHQVEGTAERSHKGLGVGLAVVKGLVELHGGRVEAASDGAGRGSEFTVRLPALPPASLAAARTDAAGPGTGRARLRVLVVDDEPDITAMQGLEVGAILGRVLAVRAEGEFQRGIDVLPGVPLVDVTVGVAEALPEEALVVAFLEVVEARPPAVEADHRVHDPRSRHPGGAKHLAGQQFVDEAGVLRRIVEDDLLHAVEPLPLGELVHVQEQPGLLVHLPPTAHPSAQTQSHVRVDGPAVLGHLRPHVGLGGDEVGRLADADLPVEPRVRGLAEDLHAGLVDLDFDADDLVGGEERATRLGVLARLRFRSCTGGSLRPRGERGQVQAGQDARPSASSARRERRSTIWYTLPT
jgi:hypothetical protein